MIGTVLIHPVARRPGLLVVCRDAVNVTLPTRGLFNDHGLTPYKLAIADSAAAMTELNTALPCARPKAILKVNWAQSLPV